MRVLSCFILYSNKALNLGANANANANSFQFISTSNSKLTNSNNKSKFSTTITIYQSKKSITFYNSKAFINKNTIYYLSISAQRYLSQLTTLLKDNLNIESTQHSTQQKLAFYNTLPTTNFLPTTINTLLERLYFKRQLSKFFVILQKDNVTIFKLQATDANRKAF